MTRTLSELRALPRIAIIIPAYNEEWSISRTLKDVEDFRDSHLEWEVLPVVVNDGSKDRTGEITDQIASKSKTRVEVIHLPLNLGIGCAVQTGLRCASLWNADVALQLDGDGQHPAREIASLVVPILENRSDVVIGSRYVSGAGGNVSSIARQVGTLVFSILIMVLTGKRVVDTTSGFRAYGKNAARFLQEYYPDDYPEVEALVSLSRKRFRILETPVAMRARQGGKSSITPLKTFYYVLKVSLAALLGAVRPLPTRPDTPLLSEPV